MSLISMASWVTPTNNRLWLLKETLQSLSKTVNFNRHRVFIVDNGSTEETLKYYEEAKDLLPFTLIKLPGNVGTARAINKAWLHRLPQEHAIKLDTDVSWEDANWADKLEDCVNRDKTIGICGLKRSDCIESPTTKGWYKSELLMLPHQPGEKWLVVEKANHIMGTCQLYNSALLDKIGFLYQLGGLYGFDDSIAAARCTTAGFYNCFYPHIQIHHLDPGTTDYQKWKEQYASRMFPAYHKILKEYAEGVRSVYHGPEDE